MADIRITAAPIGFVIYEDGEIIAGLTKVSEVARFIERRLACGDATQIASLEGDEPEQAEVVNRKRIWSRA